MPVEALPLVLMRGSGKGGVFVGASADKGAGGGVSHQFFVAAQGSGVSEASWCRVDWWGAVASHCIWLVL